MPALYDTSSHLKHIAKALNALAGCPEPLLVWLEGPFANETADRYATVEMHVAADGADLEAAFARRLTVLHSAGIPVLVAEHVGPLMGVGCMFDTGAQMNLTFEPLRALELRPRPSCRVLLDRPSRGGDLRSANPQAPLDLKRARLAKITSSFWWLAASLPGMVRRATPVAHIQSHVSLMRSALTDLLCLSTGAGCAADLASRDRADLESTAFAGTTLNDTWASAVHTCHLFSAHARGACRKWGQAHPDAEEALVRAYVADELVGILDTSKWL